MKRDQGNFKNKVYEIMSKIPRGRVATYGQVALLAGIPRAAREVGWIAHTGPSYLPWQRVVNRFGGLAKGYPGGRLGHRVEVEKDGIVVRDDMTIDLEKYQWRPSTVGMKAMQLPPEVVEEINKKMSFSQDSLLNNYRHKT